MLRQVFALTDKFAPTLLEDVMPMYPVEDASEPHLQFSKEVSLVARDVSRTSAAGNLVAFDLGPQGSNSKSILDVILLQLSAAVAQQVFIEHISLSPGGFVVPGDVLSPCDGRLIGSADASTPPRSSFTFGAQIAGVAAIPLSRLWEVFLPANTSIIVPFKAVLYRSSLRFTSSSLLTTINVSVLGLDRLAEPPEERRSAGPSGIGP